MSKQIRDLSSYRISLAEILHSRSAHLAAGAFVLAVSLLATSCGFMSSNSGRNDHQQSLTLSGNLPGGVTNQAYNAVLTVSGGAPPYQFAIKSGSLPPGMTLNASTGSVSGTPTTAGAYLFQVGVTDAPQPHEGSQSFSISVRNDNGGIRVTVSPSSTNVISNQTQTFTANVTGSENSGVTWSASAGSITTGGVYTAPSVTSVTTAVVTATSKADSKGQGTATLVIQPASSPTLAITSTSLPDGATGSAYAAGFTASGGTQPYSWTISAGLPPGLNLTANNGELSGMPSAAGTYGFTVKVTDAKSQAVQKAFALNVMAGGNLDGPAELPRATVSSSMSDTPAPGAVIPVSAGGDLQAALNNAHCGDTVELQAGATFSGVFSLPAKSCDTGHWVIVRTSAADNALPSEGTRTNPCFAGVRSLPGRPQYTCSNPQKTMARIEYPKSADGPIILRNGANHYRLVGLEITKTTGVKSAPTLIAVEPGGLANHIVIDRSWLHGTTQDETQLGISLNGMNYVAVVDSYFSDFHCTAGTGTCTDSHAVAGGLGNHVDGPFKIENNYLEAAGESVFFGGGAATVTPTDIEVRRNHFFKPWQWMPGSPNFVGAADGHPFIVKNHMELKNSIRVLVEANLMENNWGGFSQTGYALLLSPKSQHTRNNGNVCPLCQVTDITVRYNRISHAGGGIQLATSISGSGLDEGGGPALAGTRWSIHDIVIDDISRTYTGGGSLFEVMNGWPANPLNTVTINHITGFPDPDSHLMIMGNQVTNPTMHGFVFTNNLVATGRYPIWNAGGGRTSCAFSDEPVTSIATCFASYTFSNNALIGTPQPFPPSSWPAGNLFPADTKAAGLSANHALQANSPYKNMGTDGRDLGADIAGLEAALAGVE